MSEQEPKSKVLEVAKKTEKAWIDFNRIKDAIINVMSGGLTSNIIRLIVIVGFGVIWFIVERKIKQLRIQWAKDLNEKEKKELKDYLASYSEAKPGSSIDDMERDF